ncbi:MAG TPA: alpha/beta fold hydrolase [Candidatus Saccharimonadales bacterium]|nr:alpha/beta fold hydrolase [Candidatus Saccharimonadales bacterium]
MKTALILHGIGGHAGIHWQQWLADQLSAQGYRVLMPELPTADHPDRQTWLNEIIKTLQDVELSELTIIGHSLGVTTALDFLEQADGQVRKLIAVSGFAESYGAELNDYFLKEKPMDFTKVRQHLRSAVVIYGDDDPYVTQEALRYVADALGVQPVVIPHGGHLNTETGYTEFPRLLELV